LNEEDFNYFFCFFKAEPYHVIKLIISLDKSGRYCTAFQHFPVLPTWNKKFETKSEVSN